MKEKNARQHTINDLLDDYQSSSPRQRQSSVANESIEGQLWTQNELATIKDYNKNILTLDSLYSDITPLNGFIVRVFLFEPLESDGVLIPYRQMVSVPTMNGMAEYAEIESPFPYSNKAVIVATPGYSQVLQKGDIVQLGSNPIKPQTMGKGHNARVTIPTAYIHPDAKTFELPTNIMDKHYGYLLVPLHEIIIKL